MKRHQLRSFAHCLKVIGCIVLLLVVSVVLRAESASKHASTAKSAVVPIDVEVLATKSQAVPKMVGSLGSLQAINQVTISSEADGRIETIYFKNGQQVGKGMPIVQLTSKLAQADYDKAVSQLNADRLNLQRQLAAGDAVSDSDKAKTKATVEEDEADVKSKQATVAQRQIVAPFSGTLGDFKFSEGDFAKAGEPMVTLVSTDQLQAVYHLSEIALPQLKNGQLVKVTVDAYPQKIFYGTVNYISPSVDQTARTVTVNALVSNKNNLLRPGMFIHVQQQISLQQKALVIPEQALLVDVKGSYVYTVVNGRAVRADVAVGTRVRGVAQITSGLKVGDQVVVAGQQKLAEGSFVHIVPTLPAVKKVMDNTTTSVDDVAASGGSAAASGGSAAASGGSAASGGQSDAASSTGSGGQSDAASSTDSGGAASSSSTMASPQSAPAPTAGTAASAPAKANPQSAPAAAQSTTPSSAPANATSSATSATSAASFSSANVPSAASAPSSNNAPGCKATGAGRDNTAAAVMVDLF